MVRVDLFGSAVRHDWPEDIDVAIVLTNGWERARSDINAAISAMSVDIERATGRIAHINVMSESEADELHFFQVAGGTIRLH